MDHLDQLEEHDRKPIPLTAEEYRVAYNTGWRAAGTIAAQWKARCLAAESYIEAVKSPSISQTEVWKDQNRRRKEWLKLKREMDET